MLTTADLEQVLTELYARGASRVSLEQVVDSVKVSPTEVETLLRPAVDAGRVTWDSERETYYLRSRPLVTDDRPAVFVESVRPLEAPQLAGLADAVRAAGFEPEHSLPMEQRSAGAVTFIALRLADAASVLLIEQLAAAVRRWVVQRAMPRLRERGISAVVVPIYGPDGEVLSEVHVADDAPADPAVTPPARTRA